MTLEES